MINMKEIAWKRRISLQGPTLEYVNRLQQWQWMEYDKMISLQQKKLCTLLRHAHDHVPYYRDILSAAGVIASDGTVRLENFENIPLLERETIRSSYERLKSDDLNIRRWYENWSGGSTGEPVRLVQDREYFYWNQAVKMLYDEWSGRELVDKQILMWASERDLMVGKETLKTYMGRWMRNERWWNTRRMSEESMSAYVEELNGFRPVQILAYVESLYELARYIEERKLPVYSPRSIMTTAGVLHPHMRQTIQRVFQAPVFNRYGSREIGAIACECEHHKGLHVAAFTHYVEIIGPDGMPAKPRESGELVITALNNYAMPMIRYRIGDTARWEEQPCSCGRVLPVLKEISGRVTDSFVKRNGDLVDGRQFVLLLGTKSFVKKFQVIQDDVEQIKILIIPDQKDVDPWAAHADEIDTIVTKSHHLMGEHFQIRIDFVEDILPTASGKYRFTICNVKR